MLAADHAAGVAYDDVRIEHLVVDANGQVGFAGLLPATAPPSRGTGPSEELRTAAQSLQQRMALSDAINAAAYLAPERFRGGPATALSNQFSFSVVIYQAFFGKMPFEADAHTTRPEARLTPLGSVSFSLLLASLDRTTFVSLAREILAGNVQPPEHGPETPPWIYPLVKRGLSPDAEDRYPSLTGLLDEFEARFNGGDGAKTRKVLTRPLWALAAGAVGLLLLLGMLAKLTRKVP
jgi:eukaryotic-like serine/threonine-protein kinase